MSSRRRIATAGVINVTASYCEGVKNTWVLVAPVEWLDAEKTI